MACLGSCRRGGAGAPRNHANVPGALPCSSHTRSQPAATRAPPQANTYSGHLQGGCATLSHRLVWAAAPVSRPGGSPPLPPGLLRLFSSPHFNPPPGQWRKPGAEPEAAAVGPGGVHASPAFFLQRTLYMVARGPAQGAPPGSPHPQGCCSGSWQVLRLFLRLSVSVLQTHARSEPTTDRLQPGVSLAAAPASSGLLFAGGFVSLFPGCREPSS